MKEDQNSESVQVFISYSHDDSFHKANILSLAQELRSSGVNASIDRFVENDPPLSWPLWMQEQVEEADAVLLVFTETYTRRFVNRETLGTGLGAKWEGAVVTAHLYHSQAATSKFIPILIDGSDLQYVPAPLSLTTFYVVGTMEQREADSAYFEPLLRRLLGQPAIVPAPLTAVAKLPVAKVVQPPAQTKIDQALSKESPDDKVRALKGMLYDADNELSGLAAFNLGLIWQGEERFADSINAYHRAIELLPNSSEAAAAAANLGSVLERMNRHYGVGSAVQAALGWLRAIRDDDVKTAWRTIAPKTRLALAQAWLLANLTHPNVLIYDDRTPLLNDFLRLFLNTPCRRPSLRPNLVSSSALTRRSMRKPGGRPSDRGGSGSIWNWLFFPPQVAVLWYGSRRLSCRQYNSHCSAMLANGTLRDSPIPYWSPAGHRQTNRSMSSEPCQGPDQDVSCQYEFRK